MGMCGALAGCGGVQYFDDLPQPSIQHSYDGELAPFPQGEGKDCEDVMGIDGELRVWSKPCGKDTFEEIRTVDQGTFDDLRGKVKDLFNLASDGIEPDCFDEEGKGGVLYFTVNENGAGEATSFCERRPEPQIAEIADRFRELAGP